MTDDTNKYPEFNGWQAVHSLGSGSCGETFEICRDDGFGLAEHGALKVLHVTCEPGADADAQARARGQVEALARQLRALDALGEHRNILPCRDHAIRTRSDGSGWDVYIRSELATPLDTYLRTHTYGEADVARLGAGVCSALEACRSRGLIHGDIKPQNIFVSGGNFEDALDFRLGDFGMAPFAASDVTNDFAAPEVLCGEPCSAETDLYSLGMVLYWMLNERRIPFVPLPPAGVSGSDLAIARDMRLRGDPLPPPVHGSPALQAVVMRAVADHPADRFASPAEFRAALLAAVRRAEPRTAPAPAPAPSPVMTEEDAEETRAKKRKKPMIIAGAIVVAALVILIIAMALPHGGGVGEITLDHKTAEIAPGDTLQLTATVTDADGTELTDADVEWSSSSSAVATVKDGLVTAVDEGKAKITAKAGKRTAECTVTVTEDAIEITAIQLSQNTAQMRPGDTLTLQAKLSPANAPEDEISWTSSNPRVATVKKGVVTAVDAGTATITVSAGDKTAECAVTVQAASEISGVACGTPSITLNIVGGSSAAVFTVTGTGLDDCAATVKAYALDSSVVQVGSAQRAAGGTTDTYTVSVTALREGSTTVIFQITDPSDTTYSATCAVQVILSAAPPQETDEAAEIG